MSKLPPHFIDLVYDCLLKSFWTKNALKRFLRRSGVSDNFLSQLDDAETKREWLDRLFPKLESSERGQALVRQMAATLSDQDSFPDHNREDAAEKIQAAKESVATLKAYISKQREDKEREADVQRSRELNQEIREKNRKSENDLAALRSRLDALCLRLGTQEAGYEFQTWFYDLMDFGDVDCRRPYMSGGRQIDGSITIGSTTYLVELKFTKPQSDAIDIDTLTKKVGNNALCTMGILVSMSGYSSVAIDEASGAGSPLLLLDYQHLYLVLTGGATFESVVKRVRRHASQEGKAFLAVADFGS